MERNDFDKIERYINGVADDNEKQYVESLFLNGDKNLYFRNCIKKDWDFMLSNCSQPDADLSHVLDRVHHLIRKNEISKRQKPLQKFIRIYMKAAAILLLPLLISGGFVYNYLDHNNKGTTDRQVNSTIYAPLGARVSFNLPDGTIGMLNSGSHLSYPLPFNDRQVKLEGEGWFEVKSDEAHPFKISAGNSVVKALGTRFNVSTCSAKNYVEVVLQQGKVDFLDKESGKNTMMLPSEKLVYQDGNIIKSVTDPAKYSAWTEGKLVFRGDQMAEVARRIEKWYNVKVNLDGKKLEKYSFRATFQDDKLEDVLQCLSMTSPLGYQITPPELMQDGIYKKKEVTIYLK